MTKQEQITKFIHDTFENSQFDGWMQTIFKNIELYKETGILDYKAEMLKLAGYILSQIKNGRHLGLYNECKMLEYIELFKEAVDDASN